MKLISCYSPPLFICCPSVFSPSVLLIAVSASAQVLFCADLKKFQNLKEQVAHVKTESLKSENGQKGKTSPKRKPSVKVNTAKKMKLEKPHIRNRTVKEEGE